MLDATQVYGIIYALAARNGRDAALFGDCAPLAWRAFEQSCPNGTFPELWFELPLAGDPWFDLHALTSREDFEPGAHFTAGETGGYPELFSWFASAQEVRQLALSYDVRSGDIENPAIQLLVNSPKMHEPFLELAGGDEAVAAYRSFAQRIPRDWFPCYTGVFSGRPGSAVRVECIPTSSLQQAYADDCALIETHLRQAGIEHLGATTVPRCQQLAAAPFQIEFQFDVLPDGTTGETLGVSLRFAPPSNEDETEPFLVDGAAGALMKLVQHWGLADERWRLLADTMFAQRITYEGDSEIAYCYPAFVKLRWRAGEPLDAKAYLIAGLNRI